MSARCLHAACRDTDAHLLQRAAAGDADAFARLVDRHRPALTRYAASLMRRSEHDADDVVQDVFIRAHRALCAGDAPGELRPWLYRLTRNRAIDEMRRKRWGEARLDPSRSYGAGDPPEPAGELQRRESVRRLFEDIAALPGRQREALVARELDGAGLDEVAVRLGVSVAAAQKLASRARANLVKVRAAREADSS